MEWNWVSDQTWSQQGWNVDKEAEAAAAVEKDSSGEDAKRKESKA